MKSTARRLARLWIVGAVVGTTIVAASSPLFVRSYLPLRADPLRGVWTLPEGHTYRWRSEGYADTEIGPLGMPGKTSIPQPEGKIRVALWGDSQAEGVCVPDHQKLFARAEQLSSGRLEVFPLARSGEDAADWVTQMPPVERALEIDLHVLLIVDLPDLAAAIEAPVPRPSESDIAKANSAIAARLPAFIVQAARHLLTEPDETTRRRLRFSIGPALIAAEENASPVSPSATMTNWREPMTTIRQASKLPIVILFTPVSPQISGGRVVWGDTSSDDFDAMRAAAEKAGLVIADVRPMLRQSAQQGRWPHGFDNGVIGSGHLNAVGNSLVARQLADTALELIGRGD